MAIVLDSILNNMFQRHVKRDKTFSDAYQCTILLLLFCIIIIYSPKATRKALKKTSSSSFYSNTDGIGNHFKYFLVGAQKAGTSTLSKFLRSHQFSDAVKNFPKEFHLFDGLIYGREKNTTLEYFHEKERLHISRYTPSLTVEKLSKTSNKLLLGDATPKYFLSEKVARTVYNLHPNAKILISLRKPSSRAVSHLRMIAERKRLSADAETRKLFDNALEIEINATIKCGWNPEQGILDRSLYKSFTEFLNCVSRMTCSELPAMYADNNKLRPVAEEMCKYWVVSRGLYLDQLNGWLKFFPRKSFLLLDFTDIVCRMPTVLGKLEKLLSIPRFRRETYEKAHKLSCEIAVSEHEKQPSSQVGPSESIVKKLDHFYSQHNKRFKNVVEQLFPDTSNLDWS